MRPLTSSLRGAAVAATLGALAACAAPGHPRDIELTAGPSLLPGTGWTAGLSQRVLERAGHPLDVEVSWTHHELDAAPLTGRDGWDEIRGGFAYGLHADERARWAATAGVAWVRAQGDPEYLEDPGDFGGAYVGLRWELLLGEHFATGPELLLLGLDSEGTGDFGYVPQLVWRISYRP